MSEKEERSIGKEIVKEDFDPKSLRVAELRTILLENDIKFRLHDKKSELIKLFDDHSKTIKDRAEKEVSARSGKTVMDKVGKKKRKSKKKSKTPEDMVKKELKEDVIRSSSVEKDGDSLGQEKVRGTKRLSKKRKMKATRSVFEEADKSDDDDADDDADDSKPPQKSRRKNKVEKNSESEAKEYIHSVTPSKSPIASKIVTKSPANSPHRSLIIEKFESSDDKSDSTENEEDSFSQFTFKRTGNENISPQTDKLNYGHELQNEFDFSSQKDVKPNLPEDVAHDDITTIKKEEDDFKVCDKLNPVDEAFLKLEKEVSEESLKPKISTPEFPAMEEIENLQKDVQNSIVDDDTRKKNTQIIESDTSINNNQTLESKAELARAVNQNLLLKSDKEAENRNVNESSSTVEEVAEDQESESVEFVSPINLSRSIVFKRLIFSIFSLLGKLFLYVLIVFPILFALWYREERIAVGYCGVETPRRTFPETVSNPLLKEMDSFLEDLKPTCLPCPKNAICYPLMELKCKTGYILEEPWLSLHGLIPVGNRCVKDSKRQRLVEEVVSKTLELLRTKNAQIMCGEGEDDCKSGMSNEELYEIFYQAKKPWISDEEFDNLWEQVLNDLMDEPEILWRQVSIIQNFDMKIEPNYSYQKFQNIISSFTNIFTIQLPETTRDNKISGNANQTDQADRGLDTKKPTGHFQKAKFSKGYFRSNSKKYIGLKCQFEKQVYKTLCKYRAYIVSVCSVWVLFKYIKHSLQKRLKRKQLIDNIGEEVLSRLQNAATSKKLPPYMSSVQLRDVILSDIVNLNEKNKIWNQVAKSLDRNTNVKSMLLEVHGEIMKCWEWIGVLQPEDDTEKTA